MQTSFGATPNTGSRLCVQDQGGLLSHQKQPKVIKSVFGNFRCPKTRVNLGKLEIRPKNPDKYMELRPCPLSPVVRAINKEPLEDNIIRETNNSHQPPCMIGQGENGDKGFFFGRNDNFGLQPTVNEPGGHRAYGGLGYSFGGTNVQDPTNNEDKKSTSTSTNDFVADMEQKKSNENNQLFAKIIENEMSNVPMHLQLDCMQRILAVVKKHNPKYNKVSYLYFK